MSINEESREICGSYEEMECDLYAAIDQKAAEGMLMMKNTQRTKSLSCASRIISYSSCKENKEEKTKEDSRTFLALSNSTQNFSDEELIYDFPSYESYPMMNGLLSDDYLILTNYEKKNNSKMMMTQNTTGKQAEEQEDEHVFACDIVETSMIKFTGTERGQHQQQKQEKKHIHQVQGYLKRNKSTSPNCASPVKQLMLAIISLALISDLTRFIKLQHLLHQQQQLHQSGAGVQSAPADPASSSIHLRPPLAWASWIGEVPTAAELYGEAASDMPSTESFEDDDEDEELDASASNEYPDNENDESYEDPEEGEQESRLSELWLPASSGRSSSSSSTSTSRPSTRWATRTPAARVGGHAIWSDLEQGGWRRNKRDLEDRLVLASRRAAIRDKAAATRRSRSAAGDGAGGKGGSGMTQDEDFSVDDGDEDAWVHDGVDDIQIDPETKRAASEHTNGQESSIDAEYEPVSVANRTRVTTIAEVIPMSKDSLYDQDEAASSSTSSSEQSEQQHEQQQQPKPPAESDSLTGGDDDAGMINKHNVNNRQQQQQTTAMVDGSPRQVGAAQYHLPSPPPAHVIPGVRMMMMMPAAYLSLDQANRLVAHQAAPYFWSDESVPSPNWMLVKRPTTKPPTISLTTTAAGPRWRENLL